MPTPIVFEDVAPVVPVQDLRGSAMSAFGSKADISRTFPMSAFDPKRT
jgi:hypothetical protein